jgi:hypothetical protein
MVLMGESKENVMRSEVLFIEKFDNVSKVSTTKKVCHLPSEKARIFIEKSLSREGNISFHWDF